MWAGSAWGIHVCWACQGCVCAHVHTCLPACLWCTHVPTEDPPVWLEKSMEQEHVCPFQGCAQHRCLPVQAILEPSTSDLPP